MNSISNEPLYKIENKTGHKELFEYFEDDKFDFDWVFRAQPYSTVLQTTLERHCIYSGLDLQTDADHLEDRMISQFSRLYDGEDRQKVQGDKLYCLSLMRHFGAPSRLLDSTYSKYVAIYFALENAYDHMPIAQNGIGIDPHKPIACEIWCFEAPDLHYWITEKYKEKYPEIKQQLKDRSEHKKRDDESFNNLYCSDKYKAVSWENPVQLHTRLHLQQGVFLCPCDIRIPFMDNLMHPYGNNKTEKIIKIICELASPDDLQKGLERCRSMNLTRESLFPGLDGFAQSMKYQFLFYKTLKSREDSEQQKGAE